MDPNATLAEFRRLYDLAETRVDEDEANALSAQAAECASDLIGWLAFGGAAPDWSQA